MQKNTLLLLSGGLDSMACLHQLKSRNHDVECIYFDYGQAAAEREKSAVANIIGHFGAPLISASIDVGKHWESGEIKGRNALLVFAALMAARSDTQFIATGIHSGTPYYDCSSLFANRLSALLAEYTSGKTTFLTPFLSWSKKQIIAYAIKNGLPIGLTYSCERGTVDPCGTCESCKDRQHLTC